MKKLTNHSLKNFQKCNLMENYGINIYIHFLNKKRAGELAYPLCKNMVLRGGDWSKLTFVVLDIPVRHETTENRMKILKEFKLPRANLIYSTVEYDVL